MKRIRLNLTDINTRFTEGTPEALGVTFLKSDEIEMRNGLGLAIASIFGPLQLALEGASLEETEKLIDAAKLACHGYWARARMVASTNSSKCSVSSEPSDEPIEETFELE